LVLEPDVSFLHETVFVVVMQQGNLRVGEGGEKWENKYCYSQSLICWSLASQLKQLTAHDPQFLAIIINLASEVGCCFYLFLDYQHEEMNRT
jgi:hypothetical protein